MRDERVTATGWRIKGLEALALVQDAEASLALAAPEAADVLFAARLSARPLLASGNAVHAVIGALDEAIAAAGIEAPPLTRDAPVSRRVERFSGLRWDVLGEPAAWVGELVLRHPHPVIAGVPCTTHALLVERGPVADLTVRVATPGGLAAARGAVGAGQARPAWLDRVARECRLTVDGVPVEPITIEEHAIDRFVRDVLLAESREHPVAVLAPKEDGTYVVPPTELAMELLGLARVHLLERHQSTFRLTDAVGDRRLSAYWGALRVYLPDFTCADDGSTHPLVVADRLIDPVMRAELVGRLAQHSARRILVPPGVEERRRRLEPEIAPVVSPTVPPMAVHERPPEITLDPAIVQTTATSDVARASELVASAHLIVRELGEQIGALASQVSALVAAHGLVLDEVARLRTTTAVRAANTTSLERRIGSLEELLRAHFASVAPTPTHEPPVADDDETADERAERLTLVDVLRQASEAYPAELLILGAAERAAADSPYEEPERVQVILDAMAQVARRRQTSTLGTSLREAFRDMGVDYRGGIASSTSERMLQQYRVKGNAGREYECREHIVLGVSQDPRHCLRIYFTSRAPMEPRFVIGHVGRHFDVKSTT